MNRKLKQEIKTALKAPMPTRKSEFLNRLPYPKASLLETLLCQIGYIRKRFWGLSVLLFISMVVMIQFTHADYKSLSLLSSVLPLLILIAVSEISKSISYNMVELEMSCKYNLGKITLIRMFLIGSFYFVSILAISLMSSGHFELGFLRTILYSITPFLLCSYLSMWVMNHIKIKDGVYICSGVTILVSICVYIFTTNLTVVYTTSFIAIWSIAFIVFAGLLLYEIKKFLKQTEELQCHFTLTA